MGKVFVILVTSWNGESDVTSIHKIFKDEKRADALAKELNAKSSSAYSPKYEVEPFNVEE